MPKKGIEPVEESQVLRRDSKHSDDWWPAWCTSDVAESGLVSQLCMASPAAFLG